MAEYGWIRRLAALVPVVFALFLGLTSIQGLALAQEAPPSDEEPASEEPPPSDEESPPPSDGGEDPAPDSSDGGEAPPSDGGEAPSEDSTPSHPDGGETPSSSGGGDSSSGGGDSSATRRSSSGSNQSGASSKTLSDKLRRLVAANTKGSTRRDRGEKVASTNADGDLDELVASGEELVGGGGGRSNDRTPSTSGTGSSPLALTGATVLGPLGAALALIALGMVLLWWDRVKRVLIQIAVTLPVL